MSLEFPDKNIRLRPFIENDIPFLKKVYFSTREKEVNQLIHWTVEMKTAFLTQQFNAQHTYYQQNYTDAKFWVIEKKQEPIGRLYYVESHEGSIRIIDIAIIPEFQKKGLGTTILNGIFERAKDIKQPITIHVESFNPAMNLYKRLGFQKISETNGVYHLLQWNYKH